MVFTGLLFLRQVVGQLSRQHALGQHLLELAGQPGFAEDGFGIFVLHGGQ